MNEALLKAPIQAFIHDQLQTDITTLLLKKPFFGEVSNQELAEQIQSKLASMKKLPTWFATPGIYFPKKISIEQASSEVTAAFKSTLVQGNTLLDLTGGFGVDAFYFAQQVKQVVHTERQEDLSSIAAHNFKQLGGHNCTFIASDGIDYLSKTDSTFDVIYLDPSRRVENQKVFKLSDCEPNVLALQSHFAKKCRQLLLKTSPLLDIKLALNELNAVCEVVVLSVGNEMKELLFRINYQEPPTEAKITCVQIQENGLKQFSFSYQQELAASAELSAPLRYLYEPNVAWLKAGCFKLIASAYGLKKLHQHTHLYTSNELNANFPGKIFELKEYCSYGDFGKKTPVKQANCISRNFPLNTSELKKKHKLSDGGQTFLFFVTNYQGELIVIQAEKA